MQLSFLKSSCSAGRFRKPGFTLQSFCFVNLLFRGTGNLLLNCVNQQILRCAQDDNKNKKYFRCNPV
jgi:hypothetical protein